MSRPSLPTCALGSAYCLPLPPPGGWLSRLFRLPVRVWRFRLRRYAFQLTAVAAWVRTSLRPRAGRVLRRLADIAARDWLVAVAVSAWIVASMLAAMVTDGVCTRALAFGNDARERCNASYGLWVPVAAGGSFSAAVFGAALWWRLCARRVIVPVLDQPLAEARARAWDASIVWRRANLLWMAAPAHEAAIGSFIQAWRKAHEKVSDARQRVNAADREMFVNLVRMGGPDSRVRSAAAEVSSALEAASRSLLAAAAESHRLPGETEQLIRSPAAVESLADQVVRLRCQAASDGGQFMAAAALGAANKHPAWLATVPPPAPSPESVRSIVADLKRALQQAEGAAAQQLEVAEALLAASQSVSVRPLRIVWDAGERIDVVVEPVAAPDNGESGSSAGGSRSRPNAKKAVLAAAETEYFRLASERILSKDTLDAIAKASGSATLKAWQRAVRAATGHDPGQSLELVFTQPGFARSTEGGRTASHRVQVASGPLLATWPWQRVLRAVSGLDPATCPGLDRSSAPTAGDDAPRHRRTVFQAWLASIDFWPQALQLADAVGMVPKPDGPLLRCLAVPQRAVLRLGSGVWAQAAGLRELAGWIPRSLGLHELWRAIQAQDDSTLAPHPPGTTALVSPAKPGTLWSGLFGDRGFEAIVSSAADQVAGTYFLSSSFEEFVLRRLRALGALRAALLLALWTVIWAASTVLAPAWHRHEQSTDRQGLGRAALAALAPALAQDVMRSSLFRTMLAVCTLASLASAATAVLSPLLAPKAQAPSGGGTGRAAIWRLAGYRVLASLRDAAGWMALGAAAGTAVVFFVGPSSWLVRHAPASLLGGFLVVVGVSASQVWAAALPRGCRVCFSVSALLAGAAAVAVALAYPWFVPPPLAAHSGSGGRGAGNWPMPRLVLLTASIGCTLAAAWALCYSRREPPPAAADAAGAVDGRRGWQWCCRRGAAPEVVAGNPAIGMPQRESALLHSFVERAARHAVVARAEARALDSELPGWLSLVLPRPVRRVVKFAAASGSKAAFGAVGILVGSFALATLGRWAACHAAWAHSWGIWLAFPDSQLLPAAACQSLVGVTSSSLLGCMDEPAIPLSVTFLLLACTWRPMLHLNLAPAWTRSGLVPAALLCAAGASAAQLTRHLGSFGAT